jgi:hypothetical protein
MPPVGFEPTISAGERPMTYALDRAVTGDRILMQHILRKWHGGLRYWASSGYMSQILLTTTIWVHLRIFHISVTFIWYMIRISFQFVVMRFFPHNSLVFSTISLIEFVINILERALSRKKGHTKTSTTIITASGQKHRSWQLYNIEKNSLQQIQMESCQPIKRLNDMTNIVLVYLTLVAI